MKMKSSIFWVVLLLGSAFSDITIISPLSLAEKIINHAASEKKGNLEISIAAFGRIDYRKSENYEVFLASDEFGCIPLTSVTS